MDAKKRLTKTVVEALRYDGREYSGADGKPKYERVIVWDAALPKFGVRVYPTGRKTYVVRYKKGSRKRMYTIGEHGVDGLTVQNARDEAEDLLAAVRAEDADPVRERQRVDASNLGELWERYEELYLPDLRASTRRGVKGVWKRYLRRYRRRALDEVAPADVKRWMRKWVDDHGKLAANDALKLLRRLFVVAGELEVTDGQNPAKAAGIKFYREKGRDRYLDASEIKRLAEALAAEDEREPDGADFARLLLLTGCRPQELRQAEWADVDLGAGLLRVPEGRSKVGREESRELPPAAVLILKRVQEREHRGRDRWVFPRRDGKGPRTEGFRRSWDRVREAAGLDVPQYVLRHTHASWSIGQGLSLKMTGQLLGHSQGSTTDRYAHLMRDARKEAAGRVAGALEAAMRGDDDGEGGAEVIEHPSSRSAS